MPAFKVDLPAQLDFEFEPSSALLQHLKVLRVKAGATFDVLLPGGKSGVALLQKNDGKYFATLVRILETPAPSSLPVEIAIALIRWPRLEWLIEKATELGVQKVSLLHTEYSRFRLNEISPQKLQRLHKIAEETLKQCHRFDTPVIQNPQTLKNYLQNIPNSAAKILLNEKITEPLLTNSTLKKAENYIILLGPEGGLSEAEIAAIEQVGFQSYSIGKTAIRTETAALYAASAIKFYLE